MRLTHVGTATLLIEVGAKRLLTDPALDAAGTRYQFRIGLSSTKTEEPRVPAAGLLPLDAVLVSHDHHADNLDESGRALLPSAKRVLTTLSGARRLGGNATGLGPWQTVELDRLKVTAVPARHGPPGITLVDWETTGFILEWPGQQRGALYVSGDTTYFSGIDEIGRRFKIGTAILHLGGVRFGLTGPLRYTFTADGAVKAARALGSPRIVPVHYSGWTHFQEPRSRFEQAFATERLDVKWLPLGEATDLDD
jgi:L-ascorbate metabolism protein UlaG (beta-lactamase superfamily)